MTEHIQNFKAITLEQCAQLLSTLIAADTCQPAGNEAALVDFIQDRYKQAPVEMTRLDHMAQRASLVIRLPGKDKMNGTALVGHLDTVPAGNPAHWQSAPLKPTLRNGRLYGRGAADMKGGIAAMLLALDFLLQNKIELKEDILFCFTADEEKNGIGALALEASSLLNSVKQMIICEPSRDGIGLSEKGALWVQVVARGVSCHASRPEQGCNALEALIAFEARARKILDFSKVHRYLGSNSMSITRLDGGIATNIIPSSAAMEMDIRTLPGESHTDLQNALTKICTQLEASLPPLSLELKILNDRPALETDESDALVANLQNTAKVSGYNLEKRGLYFYTDASQLIPGLGIPFVILGPGDDREAHTNNESIELASVMKFAQLYASFIAAHCA